MVTCLALNILSEGLTDAMAAKPGAMVATLSLIHICAGMISSDEYAKNVRRVERFLSGQRRELTNELKVDIADAAASLDFERAGRIKRRLEVIDGLDDRQQVVFPTGVDLDLIGLSLIHISATPGA